MSGGEAGASAAESGGTCVRLGPSRSRVGVEEELFLVDPVTGRQANASAAVLERLGPVRGTVERELHACQVELITDDLRDAPARRWRCSAACAARCVATGAGLLGSGTHPSAAEGEAEITDKERYERIRELLGDAVATPVSAACTSTSGCPTPRPRSGPSTACAGTCRCCRRSPPTRRSATAATPASPPRARSRSAAGRAPACRGRCATSPTSARRRELLARAADVPDYTWFWWKLRPHPRLGTVEVRALDAQTSLAGHGGLVALVHCLARHAADADPSPTRPPRCSRRARSAPRASACARELPDADGRLRPVARAARRRARARRAHAASSAARAELERLPALLDARRRRRAPARDIRDRGHGRAAARARRADRRKLLDDGATHAGRQRAAGSRRASAGVAGSVPRLRSRVRRLTLPGGRARMALAWGQLQGGSERR